MQFLIFAESFDDVDEDVEKSGSFFQAGWWYLRTYCTTRCRWLSFAIEWWFLVMKSLQVDVAEMRCKVRSRIINVWIWLNVSWSCFWLVLTLELFVVGSWEGKEWVEDHTKYLRVLADLNHCLVDLDVLRRIEWLMIPLWYLQVLFSETVFDYLEVVLPPLTHVAMSERDTGCFLNTCWNIQVRLLLFDEYIDSLSFRPIFQ